MKLTIKVETTFEEFQKGHRPLELIVEDDPSVIIELVKNFKINDELTEI